MHNRKGFNRLGRKPSHRKALHRNMVTSLIKYEKIETTQAKAKEIRRTAEKLVTRAKVDSVHNRRIVAKTVYEKDVVNKLFTEVGPRFSDRPGGYTRILKLGKRSGDAAEMVILEFLAEEEKAVPKKKPAKKKAASKPAAPKKAAEEKVEAPPEEAKAEESTAVDEAAPADTDVAVDEKAEREASEE
jgi:large subunit ribosomal protein L17